MEGITGFAPLAGPSTASPRWPSARLWSARPTPRDQREPTTPRPHSGHSVVTAASGHQSYSSIALPTSFRPSSCRQTPVVAQQQPASWSMQPGGRTLIHTNPTDLSFEALIRDPLAWLLRVITQLQSMLAQLFGGTQHRVPMQNCISSQRESTAATTEHPSAAVTGSTTRRCSTGRYVPSAASRGRSSETSAATTQLVVTQTPQVTSGQRSIFPVAALALATAAAMGFGGMWVYKRWQVTMIGKRETKQRLAVKKDNLARQKQRFQRALVVDSVNLELPPIKDMDVQPGPVKVEKIISQANPSQSRSSQPPRANQVPGLAGESLRQWQQFMAASKAKEVTNLSGNPHGGKRGTAKAAAEERPYVALDDRMLADLSERIRKANELAATGGVAPPIPVITFEQLYANNTESDDEAMARRAAERKARWQKQQPGGATTAVPTPHNGIPRVPRADKPAPTVTAEPAALAPTKEARGGSLRGMAADTTSFSASSSASQVAASASRMAKVDKLDAAAPASVGPRCSGSRVAVPAATATEKVEDSTQGRSIINSRARVADRSDTAAAFPGTSARESSGGSSRETGEEISVAYNLQEARVKVLNANNPFAVGLFSGSSADDDTETPVVGSMQGDGSNSKSIRPGPATRQQPALQEQPTFPKAVAPCTESAIGAGSASGRLPEASTFVSTSSRRAEPVISVASRDGDVGTAAPATPQSPDPDNVTQEPCLAGSPGRGDRRRGGVAQEIQAGAQAPSTVDSCQTHSRGAIASDEMHDAEDQSGLSHSASGFSPATDADVVVPLQSPEELSAAANRVKRVPAAGQLRKPDSHEPGLARLMRRPTAAAGFQEKGRSGSKVDGMLAEQLQ